MPAQISLPAIQTAKEKAAIEQWPTKDLAAYDFYVQAISLIDKAATESGNERGKDYFHAVELLNQAIARGNPFAVVILDSKAAKGEGIDLVASVRKLSRGPAVIVLTSAPGRGEVDRVP